MKRHIIPSALIVMLGVATALPGSAQTPFDSGSTGADGPFNPLVNTTLQLPSNGVFNFTTVDIPAGVTVRFLKNAANTPVTILASGDVTIAGTIDVSGTDAAASGSAGDGNLGDDGQPGLGGPGGFNGGFGGPAGTTGASGGQGLGPGGGDPGVGVEPLRGNTARPGAGGGFASPGLNVGGSSPTPKGGAAYGSSSLLPLVGGSGGGGGSAGGNFSGGGGGGGGGGILIASSGTISVTGSILAKGGQGGSSDGTNAGGCGGGGSGGAIRLVANVISGGGTISAVRAFSGNPCIGSPYASGHGSDGRIRIETNTLTRTATTTPPYTSGSIASLFVPGNPTLTIAGVGGTPAPANPTGSADITLPAATANPVTVDLSASGIPVGTAITVTVTPTTGAKAEYTSTALSGTIDASTATAQVTLPQGPSVISASATFTLTQTAALGFPVFAEGERIEKVRVAAAYGGRASVVYITESGKEVPAEAIQ